jgi:hypothetical protein
LNTTAQQLLLKIAQIARRSDVVVHEYQAPANNPIKKWDGILPSDMFSFYSRLNGIRFHYGFTDDDSWNGVTLLSLDRDGKKIFKVNGGYMYYKSPRAPGKRFPTYFFQDPPERDVTFFLGDDSAWGVVMLGTGEDAAFYKWDNDGFLKSMGSSFTAVIDKLNAHALAHTWAYDTHQDTDALLKRLATDVPLRTSFSVKVTKRTDSSTHAYRVKELADSTDAALNKLIKLLELPAPAKGTSREDKFELLVIACADLSHLSEAAAAAISTTLKLRSRNVAGLLRAFQCGADTISHLDLELTYHASPAPLSHDQETLTRVLSAIEGVPFAHDFPGDPALIQAMRTSPHANTGFNWDPFIHVKWNYQWKGEEDKVATFEITAETARVSGLEAGKTYASTALPFVLI